MTEPNNPIECKYFTLAGGDAPFYRAVVVPFVDAIENDLFSNGIHRKDNPLDDCLKTNENVQNAPVLIAGIVGVILFVGARIGGKILDEIYTAKIQPIVKRLFAQADRKLTPQLTCKKKMYQMGVWYEQQRVLILVAIIGCSFEEILNQHDLLTTIHANAVCWITENGLQKPIHLYRLEGGKVNAVPLLFDSLMEAQRDISIKPRQNEHDATDERIAKGNFSP
ncbi:MAG: hypothetical protein ABI042_19190 [Verrucomicrobiota bacterium]